MEATKLSDAARKIKNKYHREYRKKNPTSTNIYWERKAEKEAAEAAEKIKQKEELSPKKLKYNGLTRDEYIEFLEKNNLVLTITIEKLAEINKGLQFQNRGISMEVKRLLKITDKIQHNGSN